MNDAEAVALLKLCQPLVEALPLIRRANESGHHHVRRGAVCVSDSSKYAVKITGRLYEEIPYGLLRVPAPALPGEFLGKPGIWKILGTY